MSNALGCTSINPCALEHAEEAGDSLSPKERSMFMRYKVNENCIGCGQCASICPEVFALTDEGVARAEAGHVDGEIDKSAQEAAERCPVEAIESEP